MPEITLFCEDSFHEKFIGAMINRFARDYGVAVRPTFLSSRGGLTRMHYEFKEFLRDMSRQQDLPSPIIVVADANCLGHNARRDLLRGVLELFPNFQQLVSYAIPDPHIERWMLVDAEAFRTVFGRGCTLPGIKCSKNEYKTLLRKEIRNSGIEAPLGGEEFAEDIVNEMNLGRVEGQEPSLGHFLRILKAQFNTWRAL